MRLVKQELCQLGIVLRIHNLSNVISVVVKRDTAKHEVPRNSCQLDEAIGDEFWVKCDDRTFYRIDGPISATSSDTGYCLGFKIVRMSLRPSVAPYPEA